MRFLTVCKAYSIPFSSPHANVEAQLDVPAPPPSLESQLSANKSGPNTKSDAAVAASLGTSGAMTSAAQPPGGVVDKPDLGTAGGDGGAADKTMGSKDVSESDANNKSVKAHADVNTNASQSKAVSDPVDELEKRFAALKRRS